MPYFHQKSCNSKFQQRICYTIIDVTPIALITEKGNHCQRCPRRELNLFRHFIHTTNYDRKQRVTYSQKINGHYFVITFNINCNEILYIISYILQQTSVMGQANGHEKSQAEEINHYVGVWFCMNMYRRNGVLHTLRWQMVE